MSAAAPGGQRRAARLAAATTEPVEPQPKGKKGQPPPVDNEDDADISEDNCWYCGWEGNLIVCDADGCGKVYHQECLGHTAPEEPQKFLCPRHMCALCRRVDEDVDQEAGVELFQCSSCPTAYCDAHRPNEELFKRAMALSVVEPVADSAFSQLWQPMPEFPVHGAGGGAATSGGGASASASDESASGAPGQAGAAAIQGLDGAKFLPESGKANVEGDAAQGARARAGATATTTTGEARDGNEANADTSTAGEGSSYPEAPGIAARPAKRSRVQFALDDTAAEPGAVTAAGAAAATSSAPGSGEGAAAEASGTDGAAADAGADKDNDTESVSSGRGRRGRGGAGASGASAEDKPPLAPTASRRGRSAAGGDKKASSTPSAPDSPAFASANTSASVSISVSGLDGPSAGGRSAQLSAHTSGEVSDNESTGARRSKRRRSELPGLNVGAIEEKLSGPGGDTPRAVSSATAAGAGAGAAAADRDGPATDGASSAAPTTAAGTAKGRLTVAVPLASPGAASSAVSGTPAAGGRSALATPADGAGRGKGATGTATGAGLLANVTMPPSGSVLALSVAKQKNKATTDPVLAEKQREKSSSGPKAQCPTCAAPSNRMAFALALERMWVDTTIRLMSKREGKEDSTTAPMKTVEDAGLTGPPCDVNNLSLSTEGPNALMMALLSPVTDADAAVLYRSAGHGRAGLGIPMGHNGGSAVIAAFSSSAAAAAGAGQATAAGTHDASMAGMDGTSGSSGAHGQGQGHDEDGPATQPEHLQDTPRTVDEKDYVSPTASSAATGAAPQSDARAALLQAIGHTEPSIIAVVLCTPHEYAAVPRRPTCFGDILARIRACAYTRVADVIDDAKYMTRVAGVLAGMLPHTVLADGQGSSGALVSPTGAALTTPAALPGWAVDTSTGEVDEQILRSGIVGVDLALPQVDMSAEDGLPKSRPATSGPAGAVGPLRAADAERAALTASGGLADNPRAIFYQASLQVASEFQRDLTKARKIKQLLKDLEARLTAETPGLPPLPGRLQQLPQLPADFIDSLYTLGSSASDSDGTGGAGSSGSRSCPPSSVWLPRLLARLGMSDEEALTRLYATRLSCSRPEASWTHKPYAWGRKSLAQWLVELESSVPAGGAKRPIEAAKKSLEVRRKPVVFAPGADPNRFNPANLDQLLDSMPEGQPSAGGRGSGAGSGPESAVPSLLDTDMELLNSALGDEANMFGEVFTDQLRGNVERQLQELLVPLQGGGPEAGPDVAGSSSVRIEPESLIYGPAAAASGTEDDSMGVDGAGPDASAGAGAGASSTAADVDAALPVAIAFEQALAEYAATELHRAVKREMRRRAEAEGGPSGKPTGSPSSVATGYGPMFSPHGAGAGSSSSSSEDSTMELGGTPRLGGLLGVGRPGGVSSSLTGPRPESGLPPQLTDDGLALMQRCVAWAKDSYLHVTKIADILQSPRKSPPGHGGHHRRAVSAFSVGLGPASDLGMGMGMGMGEFGQAPGPATWTGGLGTLAHAHGRYGSAPGSASRGNRLSDVSSGSAVHVPAPSSQAILEALGRLSSLAGPPGPAAVPALPLQGFQLGSAPAQAQGVVVIGDGNSTLGSIGGGAGTAEYGGSISSTGGAAGGGGPSTAMASLHQRLSASEAAVASLAQATAATVTQLHAHMQAQMNAQMGGLAGAMGTLLSAQFAAQSSLESSMGHMVHAMQQLQGMMADQSERVAQLQAQPSRAVAGAGASGRGHIPSMPLANPSTTAAVPPQLKQSLAALTGTEKTAGIVLTELASLDADVEAAVGGAIGLADLLPPSPEEVSGLFDTLSASLRQSLVAAGELRAAWAASKRALLAVPARVDVERRLIVRSGLDTDEAAIEWAGAAGQETRLSRVPPGIEEAEAGVTGAEDEEMSVGIITLGEGRLAAEYAVANANLRAHVRKLTLAMAADRMRAQQAGPSAGSASASATGAGAGANSSGRAPTGSASGGGAGRSRFDFSSGTSGRW